MVRPLKVSVGGRPRVREHFTVQCPCGKSFETHAGRVGSGRGVYCSKACMYAFRVRPRGLTYNIVQTNRAWIKPGERRSPATEFVAGVTPMNWKGDDVGYAALHDWVTRHAGRAVDYACSQCGATDGRREWANLSGEYRRDLSDFAVMCKPCHARYDRGRSQ